MPEVRMKVAPDTVAYADGENHKLVVEFALPGAPAEWRLEHRPSKRPAPLALSPVGAGSFSRSHSPLTSLELGSLPQPRHLHKPAPAALVTCR
jgi:hypothetical protein